MLFNEKKNNYFPKIPHQTAISVFINYSKYIKHFRAL